VSGRRGWRPRAAGLLACAGGGLILLGALTSTAYADAPQRVGWWNSASGPAGPAGAAAPSPTTPPGGLRVAAGPTAGAAPSSLLPTQTPQGEQILAYGAVLYALAEGSSATLQLKIAGTPQGTPQVAACPTRNATWTAGDDQPSSSEPAYDCTTQHFPGTVSADGTTISFTVKAQFESSPDLLSLAIVPDLSSTAVPGGGNTAFAVDLAPPGATSLTPQPEAAPSAASTPVSPSQSAAPPPPSTFTAAPPPARPFVGAAAPPAALPRVSVPTAAATPSPTPAAAGAALGAQTPRPPAAVASGPASSVKSRIATALGTATLLAAVLVWSLGYGVLGGRIIPLSVPLRRGPADARS
jgi:hypothetical protein